MTSLWQITILCHSSCLPFSFFKETGFSQAQPWQSLPSCLDPGRRRILNNIQHSWQSLQVPHDGLPNAHQIFQSGLMMFFLICWKSSCTWLIFLFFSVLFPLSVAKITSASVALLPGRIILLESRDASAHPNHMTDLRWHSSKMRPRFNLCQLLSKTRTLNYIPAFKLWWSVK